MAKIGNKEMNKSDGSLPFGYMYPSPDGRMTWRCDYDTSNRIVSVFCFDNGYKTEKVPSFITMDDAIKCRDILVKNNWIKLQAPEITVEYENGEKKPLNRSQRRKMASILNKRAKDNPFL